MSESLKDLSLFTTVVECGGFANSADTLGLTPSAVSKAIARLGQRLATRLFTRSTRSIKLTEAGHELYARAKDILAAVAEAETVVRDVSTEPQGELNVSCSDAFATLVLIPMLAGFQQAYPRISVHITQGDGPLDLINENYDIAIRFEEPIQKGLNVTTLTDDPWVICASPAYLKNHATLQTPRDLKHHRCLAIRARDRLDNSWTFKGGSRNTIRVNPVFTGIGMVVKAAALQDLGIARLANFLVEKDIDNGKLVPLLSDYQIHKQRRIYAVTPDRTYTPAKTQVFIDTLKSEIHTYATRSNSDH